MLELLKIYKNRLSRVLLKNLQRGMGLILVVLGLLLAVRFIRFLGERI
jgi:hypothetical protein